MGIEGLIKFIRDEHPSAITIDHIANIGTGKLIVCDISTYLYRYKLLLKEKWLFSFYKNFLKLFKKYNLHVTFIFDGKPPKLKEEERKFRTSIKESAGIKASDIQYDLSVYKDTGNITELLKNIQLKIDKRKDRKEKKDGKYKSLLHKLHGKKEDEEKGGEFEINIEDIENEIESLSRQSEGLTKEDITLVKKLFKFLGIPYILASGEAETLAAYLKYKNIADLVISVDSDTIVYGIKEVIIEINSNGTCMIVNYDKLLESMKFDKEMFMDFCIMCGTDYNKNVKKIGIKTAFKFINKYKSIENIIKNESKYDYENLIKNDRYRNVRKIFIFTEIPTNINGKEIDKLKTWKEDANKKEEKNGDFNLFQIDDWITEYTTKIDWID